MPTSQDAIIIEAFKKGLRPDERYNGKELYLEECFGLRPNPAGLEPYEPLTDPFVGNVTVKYPFPQIFLGQSLSLLMSAKTAEVINTNVSPWTKSSLTLKKPEDPSSNATVVGKKQWHFADFGDGFYLSNASTVVFRTGLDRLEGTATPITYASSDVSIQTLCAAHGRVFLGGFDSSFWVNWADIFAELKASIKADGLGFFTDDLEDGNWIAWSSVMGADFPVWLFYPKDYTSLLDPTADLLLERIRRNELGWVPLPRQGTVRVLLPLGENIIAYCDNAIYALTPTRSGLAPSTFGRRPILMGGIPSRTCVGQKYSGGEITEHVFLDRSGDLWRLGSNLQPEWLGYKEYLFALSGVTHSVVYDPQEQEYLITSATEGFGLNRFGAFTHRDRITSAHFFNGGFVGLSNPSSDTGAKVLTAPVDLGRRRMKTLHTVELGMLSGVSTSVQALTKVSQADGFTSGASKVLSRSGTEDLHRSGVEFKFRLSSPTAQIELDSLIMRAQLNSTKKDLKNQT